MPAAEAQIGRALMGASPQDPILHRLAPVRRVRVVILLPNLRQIAEWRKKSKPSIARKLRAAGHPAFIFEKEIELATAWEELHALHGIPLTKEEDKHLDIILGGFPRFDIDTPEENDGEDSQDIDQ